jgi:hypothetical protein
MRDEEFYRQCKDTKNSHITDCLEYGYEGCRKICWYAREREKRRLEGQPLTIDYS